MKKIFAMIIAMFVVALAFSVPAQASGSDSPTPYTVNENGVTLPAGDTFKAHGHVNIRYVVNGDHTEKSKGIHFDPNNNHPGGAWIGESTIPWSAFDIKPKRFCVTWVQVHGYNQHFGGGGQEPVCVGGKKPPVDPNEPADGKKVEICHYNGSNNNGGSGKYSKIEIDVSGWYGSGNDNSGHKSDTNDIWDTFTYINKNGDEVTVPAQGDTSLLEFDKCVKPDEDVEIAVPGVNHVDKCGVDNDSVTPVRDDSKYQTSVGDRVGDSQTVTFTANDGFVFPNGKKVVKVTVDFPNNDDCDLPETGGEATYYTNLGIVALVGLLGAALVFLAIRRKD